MVQTQNFDDTRCLDLSGSAIKSVVSVDFYTLSQNCEKRLLATSSLPVRLSVRLSAWNNSTPTGRIFIKF